MRQVMQVYGFDDACFFFDTADVFEYQHRFDQTALGERLGPSTRVQAKKIGKFNELTDTVKDPLMEERYHSFTDVEELWSLPNNLEGIFEVYCYVWLMCSGTIFHSFNLN